MEVSAARRSSVFNRLNEQPMKNKVCRYWLEGRCNRNPCRFLHRESPPLQTEGRSHSFDDNHRKQPKSLTWRNPNNHISKKDPTSSNERPSKDVANTGKSDHIYQKKSTTEMSKDIMANTGKSGHNQEMSTTEMSKDMANIGKSGHNQEMSTAEMSSTIEKNDIHKAFPDQCKYWITGNCVHGDKCKNLHSWFCGSGFIMLKKLEGHSKAVTGISLPSDCNKLYSGGKDGTIRVWDCSSGQCAGSVTVESEVGCLISEGPWLFAGIQNGVKAWNLQNQTEYSLNGPGGLVRTMVTDDDKLFAGMEDGTILVWKSSHDTHILEPAAMLKEHKGAVCSLVIGAGRLYSGSKDSTIKVWDLQNLQCLQTLYGHTGDVTSVLCWDSYLLSASLDNTLKVWAATESGAIEMVYEMKDDHGVISLCGIHDAEDKPILLCSFCDNTVRLYDLPSFTERGRIFSKREVQVIQIGVEGLFFTGDATGEVSVWKLLGDPCAKAS